MSEVVSAGGRSIVLHGARSHPEVARLAFFAAMFGIGLIPVLTTPIPAMVDYVNHLARMYELAAAGTPQASPFYHTAWKLYPNLAMDLVVPMLARWTGVEAATRLFLLASQILVVTGSVAIERRIQGRFATSGFVAVLYLFNVPFAWGFLNFEFAMGVALWGVAAWLAVRERPWPIRFAVHALFVALLFAGHLFALGLYGFTLGLHEAWAARQSLRPMRRLLAAALLLGTPAVALAAIMAATGGSVGAPVNLWQGIVKPFWPFLLLNGDNMLVSIAGTVALGCLLHASMTRGEVAFVASGRWLAFGFLALYIVVPGRMLDTAFVDIRVLVGAVLILPAFVTISFATAQGARIAGAAVAAVTIVNVATIERVWSAYQPIYRSMIESFGRLQPHARVLVGYSGAAADPPIMDLAAYPLYHAPTLAVHYAGAFVPTLFTTTGKQPLTVMPSVQDLSFSCGGPVPLNNLRALASTGAGVSRSYRFARNWPKNFDYVYMLGKPEDSPLPGVLDLLESHPTFALYRVRRLPGTGPAEKLSAPATP